jgi:hypothetical protein
LDDGGGILVSWLPVYASVNVEMRFVQVTNLLLLRDIEAGMSNAWRITKVGHCLISNGIVYILKLFKMHKCKQQIWENGLLSFDKIF